MILLGLHLFGMIMCILTVTLFGFSLEKLKKDKAGKHHFIPMDWVTTVDNKVHIDRPGDQAMKEWRIEQ